MNTLKPNKSRQVLYHAVLWVGVIQALILILIAVCVGWVTNQPMHAFTSLTAVMSAIYIYASTVLVPVSLANAVLVVAYILRKKPSRARAVFLSFSLLLSIGVLVVAVWVGYLLLGLTNAANQTNQPQTGVY